MKTKHKSFSYTIVLISLLFILISSCKKTPTPTPANETGTVTDIDNNTYKTVKIGNQWWMAENLKTKTYRNGTTIKTLTTSDPDSVWAQTIIGHLCEFDKNDDNGKLYGLLYNWYAVTDTNNIAPAGWHVPSDDEWKTLEMYLGMSQADADKVNWRGDNEADKLKVAQSLNWASYGSVWSTNESGFSALAGCCRLFDGKWGNPGVTNTGFWWSTTNHASDNEAWFRYLDYKNSNVFRYHVAKSYGMSIRCVKD
ncbi:MAG: fibrobacter succinogenes major paralogous domain-containing protein [Bacteroidia bacterium]